MLVLSHHLEIYTRRTSSNPFDLRNLFCSWNPQRVNKWQSLFEQFVHPRKVCNQQQAGISSPRRLITIYKGHQHLKIFHCMASLRKKSRREVWWSHKSVNGISAEKFANQQMASQQRSLQIKFTPSNGISPVHPGEKFGEEPYRSFSLVEISILRLTSPHLSADLRQSYQLSK